ncbi:MAG: hypothetical protein EOM34_00205 [Clostridia bacterium]|nr:hypothetical protein [Lachnospiraceae bacterium]NCB99087.1 hypothetical protein [Clostridia bacterium]NCD02143.1 hypothetical protein [Clostridia bacterium]
MRIEILFPEYCNLFGDLGNIMYLKACMPDAEFIETSINSEPVFATEEVNLIYMGPMSERAQEKVIAKLMPYKERIEELIQAKQVFLFTGNAMEVLFREIIDGERTIPGLNIFDFSAVRDYAHRYNGNFYGEFNERKLVGCKTQFTMAYGANEHSFFAKGIRGIGINKNTFYEGVRRKNFYGTYLVGPLLVMNPYFTQYLMYHMGIEEPKLAYAEAIKTAYRQRLTELENKKTAMEKE